jgi:Ran GTPase-activating protein (RanGAP) involved in mRNA processing and transport
VKFDVSANSLCAEGGKVLAEALKDNNVMTELNISDNELAEDEDEEIDMSGIIAIGDAIPTMGALVKLLMGGNDIRAEGGKVLAESIKDNQVMQELSIASNNLGKNSSYDSDMSGVIAISNAIPTMGAMVTVNMMGNKIGKEQLSKLQEIMKVHATLVSLCGIADNATEANLSGLRMDAEDAVILAGEPPAKGAMTSLDISANDLQAEGAKHIAAAIAECK